MKKRPKQVKRRVRAVRSRKESGEIMTAYDDKPLREQLVRIEERQHEDAREQRELLQKIDNYLTGGSEPEKGMIVRVDRLEQAEARRDWYVKAALGASICAIISIVVGAIKLFLSK
jgi:hypothetical protein